MFNKLCISWRNDKKENNMLIILPTKENKNYLVVKNKSSFVMQLYFSIYIYNLREEFKMEIFYSLYVNNFTIKNIILKVIIF